MTATITSLRPSPTPPGRRPPLIQAEAIPRQHLLDQANKLYQQAADAAETGDVGASARLILEALDCERRAGGVGPQVLQLIKPRA